MATKHISEEPVAACIKGGLMFGDKQNILEDADLATSIAVAKAAVDVDNNNLHVSERTFGPRVKGSLDLIEQYDSTYDTGSDVDKATMLAISNAGEGRSTTF